MIVVVIILMLTAVAIPVMVPALEGRRMREAARAVNVFFSSARTRAMATGRPVGVMIHRQEGRPEASLRMSYVKIPPTWSGDTLDSRVVLTRTSDNRVILSGWLDPISGNVDPMLEFRDQFFRPGDRIQLGSQGHVYTIIGWDDDADGRVDPMKVDDEGFLYEPAWHVVRSDLGPPVMADPATQPDPAMNLDQWRQIRHLRDPKTMAEMQYEMTVITEMTIQSLPPSAATGLPFQVIRQPVTSAAGGMQLPASLVIDLEASGVGNERFFSPLPAEPLSPVVILFGANGAVNRVWYSDTEAGVQPTGNIYLLIGQSARVPPTSLPPAFGLPFNPNDEAEFPNWADLGNLWITIGTQTGHVATHENAAIDATLLNSLSGSNQELQRRQAIHQYARGFTRSGQSLGGR